ncbi:NADH-quinone oxidoreductase subunit NuoI, partial [Hydrogenibacillus schlegelii]
GRSSSISDRMSANFSVDNLGDLCTEVCPTEAIVMTSNVELSETRRADHHKVHPWLEANKTNVLEVYKP